MVQPILEVKHLTKTFEVRGKEKFTAVNDVSFFLNQGETLGIVGESGSGKSTLVRAVARLTDVTSGEILLNGKEITHLKGKDLRQIYRYFQMVFQSQIGRAHV